MKLKLTLLVSLFAIGFAGSAMAGAVVDTDTDLVPDQFDNCSTAPNGPASVNTGNQVDTDVDGYGNRCDADFDNDAAVLGADFTFLLGQFGKNTAVAQEADLDGDLFVLGGDFTRLLSLFGKAPGPSGLACAGTTPCTP
jgi:hypothetical protein